MLRPFCVVVAILAAFPVAQAADAPRHPESQQEYWAQVDHKDWSAAIAAAEQLVAAARDKGPPLALSEALSLLGNAQFGAKDYTAAEKTFTESLQIVEQHAGAASAKLLDPLRGLGYALAAGGQHKEAIPPLERALLIDRRSYGLYDIGQQMVLQQLADSLVKLGRPEDAQRHLGYLIQLSERVYGRRDPRRVPILCFVASWYADYGDFVTAREIYRSSLLLVEQKLGPNDPAVLGPLRSLAGTYTQELFYSTIGLKSQGRLRLPTDANGTSNDDKPMNPHYLSSEGEKSLERAVKVLEGQPPSTRDTMVATLIQTGDWFQIKHAPERALPYYRRAAALNATLTTAATPTPAEAPTAAATPTPAGAASTPAASTMAAAEPQPLTFPVRIYYPTPSHATRNMLLPAERVDERFVEVQFTVSGFGEVSDAKITDANGTPREVADTLSAIRAARFRPKFVNGEPVETTGVTNREVFRTRKEGVDGGR